MKKTIYVTESNNDSYFDGKLSKKELISHSIERIIRNIKIVDGVQSGVVTRRGNDTLNVSKQGDRWNITGVSWESVQRPRVSKKKIHENFKTLKNISKISDYEIYLLSVVKFDCQRNDALMDAIKDGTARDLLDTIPRFKAEQKYTLKEEVFEIIEVDGNLVKYSGSDGIKRKHSEIDLYGEFLRPIKNKMEIIHSIDHAVT
jgi:hypothetical protein